MTLASPRASFVNSIILSASANSVESKTFSVIRAPVFLRKEWWPDSLTKGSPPVAAMAWKAGAGLLPVDQARIAMSAVLAARLVERLARQHRICLSALCRCLGSQLGWCLRWASLDNSPTSVGVGRPRSSRMEIVYENTPNFCSARDRALGLDPAFKGNPRLRLRARLADGTRTGFPFRPA